MEKNTEELENNDNNITALLPELKEDIKDKISLAVYHDGDIMTTEYFNNIAERFSKYFHTVYLISENNENLENLKHFNNLSIVNSLKPSELKNEWMMILESGEFPSIQLIENLEKIISEVSQKTSILNFPVVVCNHKDGEIIEVLKPSSRLFRKNPANVMNTAVSEVTLNDYPIIRLRVMPDIDSESKE